MRILVACDAQADSPAAHAINTFKMADGFARLGHEVFLVCREAREGPRAEAALRSNLSLSQNLEIVAVRGRLLFNWLDKHAEFAARAASHVERLQPAFGYFRNFLVPARAAALGIPVAAETHAGPPFNGGPIVELCKAAARLERLRSIVTIAPMLAEAYRALGVPERKILVLPSGVDLALFRRPQQFQRSARARPRIVYSGHFYDHKGIPTILAAAQFLTDCDFVLLGGFPEDIARQRARIDTAGLRNVTLAGMKFYAEVPQFLWDADVLLLPPSADHPSAAWTSPVKLGEYLSSGTPMVATAIPALRNLLTDEQAAMVRPDDAADLAQAIRRILEDRAYANGLAQAALLRADALGYPRRAEAILRHAAADASKT